MFPRTARGFNDSLRHLPGGRSQATVHPPRSEHQVLGAPGHHQVLVRCLVLVLLLTPTAIGARELSFDRIRAATEQVYTETEYQTELPGEEPAREPPAWLERLAEWLRRIFAGGHVLEIILFLLVAAVVAVLLIWLTRAYSQHRAAREHVTDGRSETEAAIEMSDKPLGDAAALAADHDFAAAIHVLLLRTIDELVDKLDYDPAPSLTSREILTTAPLSERAREALAALVRRVEFFYFGTKVPERADYDRCVGDFENFVMACRPQ